MQRTAKICFLCTSNQHAFTVPKQLELTSVVPQQSTLYIPWMVPIPLVHNSFPFRHCCPFLENLVPPVALQLFLFTHLRCTQLKLEAQLWDRLQHVRG